MRRPHRASRLRRGFAAKAYSGEFYHPYFAQCFNVQQGVEDSRGYRRVYLDDGQGMHWLCSRAVAAEREVGDVDAVFAKNRSDLSDHAGHVHVAADNQGAFEWGFHVDAVEFQQARLLAVDDGGGGVAGSGGTKR